MHQWRKTLKVSITLTFTAFSAHSYCSALFCSRNQVEEVATNNNPAQSTEPTNSDNSNFNKDSIIDTTSNATASSSNNNNITDTNISTATTNIGKAGIDAEKILFEDKVITKHTRLVNLVLKPDSILWNEKGIREIKVTRF